MNPVGIPFDLNKGKVLVTGGTGFLGAYIIEELIRRQYQVKAIRRSKQLPFFIPASVLERVEWKQSDILDVADLEQHMEGCDYVVHAAAKISFASKDQKEMYKTNIEGTANVVNAALEAGVRKLVYISSVEALGRSKQGDTVGEGKQWDEIKLDSHYGRSKYLAEMEVWRAIAEGLHAVIVNPSTILGFGDWNNSSCVIFKNIYNEIPWYSNGINGFVDVEDIARAVVLLMEGPVDGERFILSAENLSFREVFDQIAAGLAKRQPRLRASPFLAGIGWRVEKMKTWFTGKNSPLTKESARLVNERSYFDNSKILGCLRDFSFTPLSQTIARCCAAYLDNTRQPV